MSNERLSERQLFEVLMGIINSFNRSAEVEANALDVDPSETDKSVDWEAFQTLINNLPMYVNDLVDPEYIAQVRKALFGFLIKANDLGLIDEIAMNNYADQIKNQMDKMLRDYTNINIFSHFIHDLFATDTIQMGQNLHDFSFDVIAMLMSTPQKLASYINSASFRTNLYNTCCYVHSLCAKTASQTNKTRFAECINILYLLGVVRKGVDDAWLTENDYSEEEFSQHLAALLGLGETEEGA